MSDLLDDEFLDYLNEFKNVTNFDAEICPKCGLDLSKDQVKIVAWFILKDDYNFDQLESVGDLLDQNGIHYFFSESEKSTTVNKLYTLKVMNDSIETAKKLLAF